MAREIKTQVTNAVLYVDGTIRIDNVRFSYPHLDVPYAKEADIKAGKTPNFGIVALMDKKTHVAAKNLIKARIEELMTENKCAKLAADRKFLRDGDLSAKDNDAGMFTVSARETTAPKLRDRAGNALVQIIDNEGHYKPSAKIKELFYGGAYGSVLIRPWYQDHKEHGKRVNSGLVAVQYVRKGDPFGESRISDDDVDETFESHGGSDEGFEGDADDL